MEDVRYVFTSFMSSCKRELVALTPFARSPLVIVQEGSPCPSASWNNGSSNSKTAKAKRQNTFQSPLILIPFCFIPASLHRVPAPPSPLSPVFAFFLVQFVSPTRFLSLSLSLPLIIAVVLLYIFSGASTADPWSLGRSIFRESQHTTYPIPRAFTASSLQLFSSTSPTSVPFQVSKCQQQVDRSKMMQWLLPSLDFCLFVATPHTAHST
mmetsp:Transcript_30016/g.77438  ORF Transcript_30016/g.77438 Transcript_30016/m.77438 type:complete len:210 (-) Transcript_30016:110-739(-)